MSKKNKKLQHIRSMQSMARHASSRLGYAADSLDHCHALIEALMELTKSSNNNLVISRLAKAAENYALHTQHFVDLDSKKMWETHIELKNQGDLLEAKICHKKPDN